MFTRQRWILCSMLFFAAVFAGCGTVPRVTRVDPSRQVDLSGRWTATDSRLVSEEMVRDVLSRPWLDEFVMAKQKQPRVIVGTVLNRSHEHISTETFVKDLERELLNSGRVRFVASRQQREEIRDERLDQAEHARPDTVKGMRREYGADFMLKGQINTILDEAGRTKLKYYQVELELINILTNEKAWIGQKKIKKIVERPRFRM